MARTHRPKLFGTALALAACGGAEPDPVHKPTPPDMAPLAAIYDAPDGVLTPDTAAEAYDAALDIVDRASALGVDQALLDTVLEAIEAKESDTTESQGAIGTTRQALVEGEGYLVATRICDGFGPEPVPDPDNGQLQLIVGFTESSIDAVVFGSVQLCQHRVDASEVLLRGLDGADAGEVKIYFGGPVPFDGVAEASALFDFDLSGEVDGALVDGDFDFRLDAAARTFEVRIATSTGDLIGVVSADAFSGVRAANGDFGCDEVARTCSAGGETISF